MEMTPAHGGHYGWHWSIKHTTLKNAKGCRSPWFLALDRVLAAKAPKGLFRLFTLSFFSTVWSLFLSALGLNPHAEELHLVWCVK